MVKRAMKTQQRTHFFENAAEYAHKIYPRRYCDSKMSKISTQCSLGLHSRLYLQLGLARYEVGPKRGATVKTSRSGSRKYFPFVRFGKFVVLSSLRCPFFAPLLNQCQ